MVNLNFRFGPTFVFLLLPLFLQFHSGKSDLQLNYYRDSCPRAEEIIYKQVKEQFETKGHTAISSIRLLFHDCFVGSCDASILLDTENGVETEKTASANFGMRNYKKINTIKDALENECPMTVSCADIIALSARDASMMLGGPSIEIKTGRKDSTESHASIVESSIPSHNASMSSVLSAFRNVGVDTEGTVALLGAHSVGRTHCMNLVSRLYPDVDPTLNYTFVPYLMHRCSSPYLDPEAVEYVRNDLVTPFVLDNMYYNNILNGKGLLLVDAELASDPRTKQFVVNMAADNDYFHQQFSRAMTILSEYNTLTGDQGEVRKDCRHVNQN